MDLKDKKCVPCSTYVPPLPLEEKHKYLSSLSPEWKLTENDSHLRRNVKFKNDFSMSLSNFGYMMKKINDTFK